MVEVKRLGGVLNLDDKETDILPIQHISAKNGKFFGGQNGLSFQNVQGNYKITNSSLPAGTNECVGAGYDSVKHRILFFIRNSNGNSGLFQLLIQTGVISKIFLCGTDSATDILRLSLDFPICSMVIVYRTEGDGDLFYFTDGNVADENRPRYFNLDTISALAPFTEDMINAAKLPPLVPPANVGYVSDSTVNANRVKNKYFQFTYRWVYKSLEKSTFAPFSIVPIPESITNPQADISTNTNNAIDISVLSAATKDFKAIEIAGRVWLGSAWSDFFLIQTVTVDDIATPIPFSYSYRFYNNGTYSTIPTDDTDLYFDWLPDYANAMELLNGNVLIYGGITDGYEPLTRQDVNVQIATTTVNSSTYPAVSSVMKWSQYQRYGLQYFDKRGKPIGGVVSFLKDAAIDTTNFDFTTTAYSGEVNGATYPIPKATMTINHTPPQDAESYVIVRADLTPPFFLYWVTNNYQQDAEYLYFCIQSLIEANTKNGFLPSYEFIPGDRVRAIASFTSTENTTVYIPQLDFQILEVVQRIMDGGNPATNGAFIKVKRPASFPGYAQNTLIEIYTPPPGLTNSTTLFYEWGQRYGFQTILGIKYHLGGTQNQTASLPAITEWTTGDVYLKTRQIYPTIGAATYTLMVMDRRYNDFQESAANSNGRGWVIDPNARLEHNGVLVRWGGKYQSGTNINNLNRFRPNDFDEVDRAKGEIRRFKARDRILRVFQDRGVGQYGIYARFIQNNEGVPELVTTNEIITTNNINYYKGEFGLGGYPTNLCSAAQSDYFVDITTGREIRLSGDGITDLGLLYKGQFYLPVLVTPYNKEILRANGSIAKVMKFWDSFENEAHTVLQAGSYIPDHPPPGVLVFTFNQAVNATVWGLSFSGAGGTGDVVTIIATNGIVTETFLYTCSSGDLPATIRDALIALINASSNFGAIAATHGGSPGLSMGAETLPITVDATITYFNSITAEDQHYSFNEGRNAFCCDQYDYHPEWALSADDKVYLWKNGEMYKHDSVNGGGLPVPYCNFFGVQYDCSITVVFNPNVGAKKTWQSITEIASDKFSCPSIYTDSKSYGSQRQETNLVAAEFVNLEDKFVSAVKRDSNSRGLKINGDFMKGSYLAVKFQKENASDLITLSQIIVLYIDSPLNVT